MGIGLTNLTDLISPLPPPSPFLQSFPLAVNVASSVRLNLSDCAKGASKSSKCCTNPWPSPNGHIFVHCSYLHQSDGPWCLLVATRIVENHKSRDFFYTQQTPSHYFTSCSIRAPPCPSNSSKIDFFIGSKIFHMTRILASSKRWWRWWMFETQLRLKELVGHLGDWGWSDRSS